jgi:hypothetical protein
MILLQVRLESHVQILSPHGYNDRRIPGLPYEVESSTQYSGGVNGCFEIGSCKVRSKVHLDLHRYGKETKPLGNSPLTVQYLIDM